MQFGVYWVPDHLLQFRDGAFGVGNFDRDAEELLEGESFIAAFFSPLRIFIFRFLLFFFFFIVVLCWDLLPGMASGGRSSHGISGHTHFWGGHTHRAR